MQHHAHHPQQGPPHLPQQQPRPSSIVHHQQQPPPPPQHSNPYSSSHGLQYPPSAGGQSGQQPTQEISYYSAHPSPYSTPSASATYSSAEAPEIMAAAQMTRPAYPPISYHTPQSNSPQSVASPAHDHNRMYGGPAPQNQQMYYAQPPPQYPPPYPHPQQQQQQQQQQQPQHHHPSITSQPTLLMSHPSGPHQLQQQHPAQQQQPSMTESPRTKIEPLARPAVPLTQHPNGPPMNQNNVPPNAGVNPNAAPGPIPATTPLVVRQDNNGVQWIAFEYSRDRVKMEYTIRCDVESVNAETLSAEFKTENCVYPRACCSKDQYRGNRLVYETECNTVGWALAELNPCLRGKRGLIQRAVDSWRNSNQDPRLRSRRVRRMAKINHRKAVQASTTHTPHMAGPSGPTGMAPGSMVVPGSAGNLSKQQSLSTLTGGHHHHTHPDGSTRDDVGEDEYIDEQQHHHHHSAAPNENGTPADDVRQTHVFPGYSGSYPPNPSVGGASVAPAIHDSRAPMSHGPNPIAARSTSEAAERDSLFADIPDAKKRKFILVEDPAKGARVRVRVTLEAVNTEEIPDSFRKSNSVYPRSWFPMDMQSPPPSARGSRFFEDDDVDDDNGRRRGRTMVSVPLLDGAEAEVATPRMRKSQRAKEVKLNDLGYRMTWQQGRVFADKTVFLQKACKSS
ncbi:hypothetical protein B7494_g8534 [Chlorociboria aeruginascens]|nr:hypothetical protein B7494_g8534 [Chlorociboria aeruginascens]